MRLLQPVLIMLFAFAISCDRSAHGADELPSPRKDIPLARSSEPRTAVFAGGCFWCVEAVYEQLDGVKDEVSGYAGGTRETAVYKIVSGGSTKHAEAVKITYDPSRITYGQLLKVFFATHDPTTRDRQGPDTGHQYRSAIFYATEEEKQVAEAYIRQLDEAKAFKKPIVTTVEPLDEFYPAEEYHQNFAKKNPNHPYILQWAAPKVEKTRQKFADQVKKGETEK